MEIKGILFDKDGTLIDFYEVWGTAVHPVMEQLLKIYGMDEIKGLKDEILEKIGVHGTEIDPEGAFAWKPYEQIAEEIAVILRQQKSDREIRAEELKDHMIRLFYREIVEKRSEFPVFTDMKRLAGGLGKMEIQMGIATTDEEESTRQCMKKLGIYEQISFYGVAGKSMPVKPDRELLLSAAAKWKLDPGEIAVVGDTPNDMRFARNAGAVGIGVLSGTGKDKDMKSTADYIIDSVDDLLPLLIRINGKEIENGDNRIEPCRKKI